MSPITKETFVIQGLAGEQKLQGTVKVNGAKNAALKAMATAVLFDGPVTLNNIPDNADVCVMSSEPATLERVRGMTVMMFMGYLYRILR